MIKQITNKNEILETIGNYFKGIKGKLVKTKWGYRTIQYRNSAVSIIVVFNPYREEKKKLSSALIRVND